MAVLDGEALRLEAPRAGEEALAAPRAREAQLAAPGGVLSYELVDAHGAVVSTGVVPDERHLRSEWVEGDSMAATHRFDQPATLGMWLPRMRGEVRVYEDIKTDGARPIATAGLHTTGGAAHRGVERSQRSLLSFADLGRPRQRLWGQQSRDDAIDILFVPDGYTADELPEFRDAARGLLDGLFDDRPEFGRYQDRFGGWYVDIPSADSGLSDVRSDISLDTAFDVSVSEHNVLTPGPLGRAALKYLKLRHGMELVVVLVNNTEWHRGSASGRMISMLGQSADVDTFAHELGHALVGLADEYVEPKFCDWSTRLRHRSKPNVDDTAERDDLKWADLVAETTPLPTDPSPRGGVGAFEGAGYCEGGWFRPEATCLMRHSGPHTELCAVCRRELARVMASF